jgi:hypothetical protein
VQNRERLLDAAHIVVDADERFGQLIVSNGLPVPKIHHAAFDAHLIAVDGISVSTSPTGCSASMMVRSSNSASKRSSGKRSGYRDGARSAGAPVRAFVEDDANRAADLDPSLCS